jgi:NADPH:quinone reductase-like Zn-dependent oxidoreductase
MKIPDNISDVDAATQGIALITMVSLSRYIRSIRQRSSKILQGVGVYRTLKLPLPEESPRESYPIFINGGSTAMGISAIQFGKLSGATIITTSSPSNADYLKSLGADHVLDYKSTTLVEDVLRLANGPVHHVFDTYPSNASTTTSASVLSQSGNAKYVALVPGFEKEVKKLNPSVDAQSILAYSAFGNPWMYENEYFDAVPGDYEFQKKFILVAERLFAEGKVKAPRVFLNRGGSGLEGILRGLEEMRDGRVSGGKLVYTTENEV